MKNLYKFYAVILVLLLMSAAGCNSNPTTQTTESEYPFPSNIPENVVQGKIIVSTPSGDSEEGKSPVLIVDPDTVLDQIGLNILEGWDTSKEVFIYVNKYFVDAEQPTEYLTQTSITLEGNLLKPGAYTVEAVQFDNGKPDGKVTHYAIAKYEIQIGN